MINNNMDNNDTTTITEKAVNNEPTKKPDESSGVYVEARVKIFDPESQEVYFAGRA